MFQLQRLKEVLLSSYILVEKAEEIAKKLEIDDFEANLS